ncbi:MAG: Gfo/Idh/MocA family oxidoreductase, partial [Planktomarina sp.]|nr:Gfo/Idh/MocA family oxidoreductase [Planktomarina sp.]
MIGTALIGFGWWGQHIARRLKDHPDFDILSVVEPALELHTQIEDLGLNAALGYEAALNDPSVQAVILTSPNDLHDNQILEAVAAGKHVFCEKPLSLNAKGARVSIEACRNAGLVLGIGHERRFEPAISALREMLEQQA